MTKTSRRLIFIMIFALYFGAMMFAVFHQGPHLVKIKVDCRHPTVNVVKLRNGDMIAAITCRKTHFSIDQNGGVRDA